MDRNHSFGIKGAPGGDCKRVCVRHQRMVDRASRLNLQESVEQLPTSDQEMVNSIWSMFSASRSSTRIVALRGLLTICCPSQLSFLNEQLKAECRLDPLVVLPKEIALRILSNLDACSLGLSAQVSKRWNALANDDVLWKLMCEQHIHKKCANCGWGLPLLQKQRTALRESATTSPQKHALRRSTSSSVSAAIAQGIPPIDVPSIRTSASKQPGFTRPWKSIYCERLAIERNWRKGSCAVSVLSGHTDAVTCVQLEESLAHPKYPVLMSGSWDRTVKIWNVSTGQCVGTLRGHTRGIRALQFDSAKLITGSMDRTLKIWNWRSGQCLKTLEGHTDAIISLNFDDSIIVSGSADKTIRIWNFETAECHTLRGHEDWVNRVELWSPASDACATEYSHDASSSTYARKFVFSASDDGMVKLWDLSSRTCIRSLAGHVAQVQSLKVLEYGGHQDQGSRNTAKSVARAHSRGSSADEAGDCNSLNEAKDITLQAGLGSGTIDQFTKSKTFPVVITGSLDNTVKLWDVDEGVCAGTLFGHIEGVWGVDANQLRVISASHDRTIKIWDREMGKCQHTLVGHCGAVTCLILKDDKIISGSDDATIRIWDFGSD